MVTFHLQSSDISSQHWVTTINDLHEFLGVSNNLTICFLHLGEKLADEEVGELLNGHEDSQGNVNYEEFVRAVMSG